MKLRNLLATASMALFIGASSMAQSVEDIRIYINPGHGSWSANCRPMGTVKHGPNNAYTDINNDTTNFFESNTNLYKGFGMLEKLIEYGIPFDRTKNQTNDNPHRIGAALDLTQQIVMSRVKTGGSPAYSDYTSNTENPDNEYYDRPLSTIAAEVEANNFDMFVSIHSNAASGIETNYLYFAWDNKYINSDGTPKNDTGASIRDLSIEMAEKGWNQRILDRHQQWTHYDCLVGEGSVKIGQQNLGVLNHSVPGYLVEGYFHTYQPARHRAMNWDVDRLEGVDYARGVADYFGWTKEANGDIYGVVRDLHEKFNHEFYNGRVGTPDVYKPLNNVKAILKKDGVEVATYTTDDEYNGAFIFRSVAPGDYTVEFEHADYKPIDPITVTVKAAATSYPTAYLENVAYIPPKNVYVNYPDSLAGKDYTLADAYNVEGAEISLLAEQLADKTVRRQIIRDNKLYVLALDSVNEPYIYLADLVANTVIELDKAAVVMGGNGRLKISDIALTADHVLIASGLSKNQYDDSYVDENESRGSVNFYKWTVNEKTGLPETCEILFTSDYACNFFRGLLGNTISYSGTLEDGILTATCPHGTHTENIAMRLAQFAIVDGQLAGTSRIDCWVTLENEIYFYPDALSSKDEYELKISPVNEANFIFDGDKVSPFEWTVSETSEGLFVARNELIAAKANGANFFKYNGKIVMVSPAVNEEGKVTGIVAFDVTNGLDKATEIKVNGAAIEPMEYTHVSAYGELALELDESDRDNIKTIGAEIEFFLAVDGTVHKYTTAGVKQPAVPNAYAYALTVNHPDDGSNNAHLGFNLTGSSSSVDIILTPVNGGENIVYNLGSLGEGGHNHTIDMTTVAKGDYTWSISVANRTNIGSDIVFSDNAWGACDSIAVNGGIAIDNNPESVNFGNIYVSTDSLGIYVYDADGVAKSETGYWAKGGRNLNRGAVSNGKFYVADNSSSNGGVWMLDPANPTTEHRVSSGNAVCAVDFVGEGEERDMYAVGAYEDASGYQLLKYENIGTADTWSGAPVWVVEADAKMFGSSHHSLIALESGLLISQYREGSSNYAPGFFFIDNAGTVYNYATDLSSTLPGCKKSGMALSKDGALFAIIGLNNTIQVYDVVWTDGIPAFTHKTAIPTNDGFVWQMAFDYANNLHCFNDKAGYCVHAVPCDANTVVTPAKADYTITGLGASAIDVIEAEETDAPVEYYNLQGIKVANPEKGIFIKKQGNKVTKVMR